MKHFKHLLIAWFLFSTLPSGAQTNQDTLAFSLEEAMNYASENAFEKISSDYDVTAAKKKI